MKLEDTQKLINNVIENEFRHISQYKENHDFNADVEISSTSEKLNKLLRKMRELVPENFELINELDSEIADYCNAACRYYFKEGIIAGTTTLKFLEETHIMNMI